ncbi:MAG: hypothetical protein LC754_12315 [Acidobacteria bacterium]|nr:hypothetical protein [Acidobacteriota bacterium]
MKDLIKSELKTWAQYTALAIFAGWLHFAIFFGSIPGINLHEAWRNYEPLMRNWLIIFVALGGIRFLLVLFLRKVLVQQ